MQPPNRVLQNASLKAFNTFAFDYQAEFLAIVATTSSMLEVVRWAKQNQLAITVLGGGSNLLIKGNISGLVIINQIKGISIKDDYEGCSDVTFAAGEVWHDCVSWAVEQNYGGIENLALIPGTAGAAPVQNIGAYGVEIKDVLQSVTVLDLESLDPLTVAAGECGFGYRDSNFKHAWKAKYIILSITVRLSHKPELVLQYGGLLQAMPDSPTIHDVFKAVCRIRAEKLPNPAEIANSGSFFKNPVVNNDTYQSIHAKYPDVAAFSQGEQWKIAAGWLNDRAGWKGYRENGVGVYPKQALVLVNYSCHKADALLALEEKIKASIKESFGIELEREPVLLGDVE